MKTVCVTPVNIKYRETNREDAFRIIPEDSSVPAEICRNGFSEGSISVTNTQLKTESIISIRRQPLILCSH